jgi:hypothetical protein
MLNYKDEVSQCIVYTVLKKVNTTLFPTITLQSERCLEDTLVMSEKGDFDNPKSRASEV